MAQFKCSKQFNAPRGQVYDYLVDPKALPKLLSRDIDVEVSHLAPEMVPGSIYSYVMTRFGFSQPVKLNVVEVHKGSLLVYRQSQGLFTKWVHTQIFEDLENEKTLVTDRVEYQLPLGILGHLVSDLFLRKDMQKVLENRLDLAASHFS